MRVSVIQLAYGDTEPMTERIHRVAGLVEAQSGTDLVVLPELWNVGGFAYRGWADQAQTVEGSVAQAMAEAAANIGAYVHAGSIIERPGEPGPEGRGLWNTSMLFAPDGELISTYRKIHRFGFGQGEPKLLEAGEDIVVEELTLRAGDEAGSDVPGAPGAPDGDGVDGEGPEAAPAVADTSTVSARDESRTIRVGLSTCYDLRFPELYRRQVDEGAELFVVPAAWPSARVGAWRALLRARAIENQAFVVACNTGGTHARTEMGGNSAIIATDGEVLAEAGRGERVVHADLDLASLHELRESFPALRDRRL